MKTSYCFPADEPRPFPEEWYQHGYIENNEQPGTARHVHNEGSYATAPADNTWVSTWEDDRMGMMEHPHRGKQNYLLEISLFCIVAVVNVVYHVRATPEKFENAAFFLRLGLPSTLTDLSR